MEIEKLQIDHDYKAATAELKGRHAALSHVDPDHVIDHNVVVITPTGEVTAVLIKQQMVPELCRRAYEDWRTAADELVDNRSTAAGSVARRRSRPPARPRRSGRSSVDWPRRAARARW